MQQQKEILFNWHNEDETTTEEIVRTNLIATYQENIPNPFIIDSTLINRCYFNIYNYGDINEDGFINITDILYTYVLGKTKKARLPVRSRFEHKWRGNENQLSKSPTSPCPTALSTSSNLMKVVRV